MVTETRNKSTSLNPDHGSLVNINRDTGQLSGKYTDNKLNFPIVKKQIDYSALLDFKRALLLLAVGLAVLSVFLGIIVWDYFRWKNEMKTYENAANVRRSFIEILGERAKEGKYNDY